MIKVASQGKETKELEYQQGMTVDACLKAAGIDPGKGVTITVNGKDAVPGDTLKDGDMVVVTPKVKNG